MYVPNDCEKVTVVLNRLTFETVLKQMSYPLILNIVPIYIPSADSFENLLSGSFSGFINKCI